MGFGETFSKAVEVTGVAMLGIGMFAIPFFLQNCFDSSDLTSCGVLSLTSTFGSPNLENMTNNFWIVSGAVVVFFIFSAAINYMLFLNGPA